MIKRKERSQIEIRKASENEYYFVFRLPNDSIFISIFFENIVEAVAAAENIKRNSMNDNCYLPKNDTKEQSYFIFHAANKSTIGQSSIYKCRLSLEAGIRYMKKYLVDAEVSDLTT